MGDLTGLTHLGGDGDAVVLVHGFGADHQSFTGNISKLVDQYSVWGLDLPGHGIAWNVTPDISSTNGFDGITRQSAQLLESIETDSIHLIGHSLGATIALLLADRLPMTQSLTMISPVGLGQGVDPEFIQSFCDISDVDSAKQHLDRLVHDTRLISPMIAPLLVEQLSRKGVRDKLRSIGNQVTEFKTSQLTNVLKKLSETPLKTMIVWGKEDSINPFKPTDQDLFDAEWHVIPNCGHLPHIEHRIRFDRAVFDLLDTITQPGQLK